MRKKRRAKHRLMLGTMIVSGMSLATFSMMIASGTPLTTLSMMITGRVNPIWHQLLQGLNSL